ncbi:MAG: penicillin-binding protein 2 [Pseudomonadota bacterium]
MSKKISLQQTITRRTLMVGAGQILLGSALIGRMAYLQIWQSEHYKNLAQGNSIKVTPILPDRGIITDCNGVILAQNTKHFRAILDLDSTSDLEATLDTLSHLIELPENFLLDIQNQTQNSHPHFIIIKEKLSWKEVARLEAHAIDLPGIQVTEGSVRFYPHALYIAHVIGYVQSPSAKDLQSSNKIIKIAGMTIGKSGLEKTQNPILQGVPGYHEHEVNARRQILRTLQTTPSKAGGNLGLTLNSKLQGFVHERLGKELSASVVVMDIHQGDILALNSHPSFDPNLFSQGISQQDWQSLLHNPYKPLINKAISGEYPPGSLFKLVVAIAALDRGLISPEHTHHCPGFLEVSNHRFHCVRSSGHGRLNLTTAIAQSCDVYFYKLALQLGIERIAHTARLLGLGTQTGIELSDERAGLIPTKSWKRKRFGKPWFVGETIIASIGQGYVLATPLQMAVMMAQISNGGHTITPSLIAGPGPGPGPGPASPQKIFSPKIFAPILEGTHMAINSKIGTGYRSRILQPDMRMGGKTSTSQVRRISIADRKSGQYRNEKSWKQRDHSIFVGYAPVHKPKYVAAVVVEHGGWGSKTAAPIARDILLTTQQFCNKD